VQLKEDIFGVRFRVKRELGGDKGGEKFLREQFAGHPDVAVKAYMAWACLFGKAWGMPALTDPVRGQALALEAVAEGSLVAMDAYGRAIGYEMVPGVPAAQSIPLLQKAADAGVPRSLARLAWYHAVGFGFPRDLLKGIQFARRAAELGYSTGLVELATGLEAGQLTGRPEPGLALDLEVEAAWHADGDAWRRLKALGETNPRAKLLLLAAQVHEANEAAWMMPGKARGRVQELEKIAGVEPRALLEVGESYLVGYYAKRDYEKAGKLLRAAAAQGNVDAKFLLAKMKLRGFGQPKEPAAALAEIQQLADAGNYRAEAYLGWVHYWGVDEAPGVAKDAAMAFRYVRQAAEHGDVWSLVNLGSCYEHGIGTQENYALAAKVYWQAYVRGYLPGLEKTQRLLAFVKS
jgi:TPR repeat protein